MLEVLVVGLLLALVANQVSPRGLSLRRDYFKAASRASHGGSATQREAPDGPATRIPGTVSAEEALRSIPADVPVVDEAVLTLRAYGFAPERIVDVGVAGIHRLLDRVETVQTADAIICAAGMEGALASVIGGLSGAPIVAVPTSVGYGSSLEGVTALLAMHASCAAGVTVVGIDNGFGAACAVARILNRRT